MKLRDVIFWLHLSIGVVTGLLILNMAVTGTILAFEPQIVDFADRGVRSVTPSAFPVEKIGLDVIVAKVREYAPEGKLSALTVKSDPKASVVVALGRESTVYVNPYTGEVLGNGKIQEWMHKVEDWHRWLGSQKFGKPVTGTVVILFFIMIVSGIYIWWPRTLDWNTFKMITRFNPNVSGKARDWNWHNVIGFWCAPMLLVTTLTGTIMAHTWATNALYRVTGNEPPSVSRPEEGTTRAAKENRPDQPTASLDAFFVKAQEKVPGWISINMRLPQGDGKPVVINIQEPILKNLMPRSQLTLDPSSAVEIKWEPFSGQNLGRKARLWVKPIHTGQAAGLPGQIVMCIGAMGAMMLVWTGLSMAWQRFAAWRLRKPNVTS